MLISAILRPAWEKDLPGLKKLLKVWLTHAPSLLETPFREFGADADRRVHCRVLEIDKTVSCASLWSEERPGQVRIHALGFGTDKTAAVGFMQEEIQEWERMGVRKTLIKVPTDAADDIVGSLKKCGFMFEGVSAGLSAQDVGLVRLCKHFVRRSLEHGELADFLQGFLSAVGFEIRPEKEGFGYRIKQEYLPPFGFSPWHRITKSGNDYIVHPPARILEPCDVENLLHPLKIIMPEERPLMLSLEPKRAEQILELPEGDERQDSLFGTAAQDMIRRVKLNSLTFCHPMALNGMRRGLPIVFYVNRIGAVGTARVDDWRLDEPKNLYNQIDELGYFDPEDVKDQAAQSGPSAGKVMVIRFNWYKPFRKAAPLEVLRSMDDTFNPQRNRSISIALLQALETEYQ
jgi:hypothetical protein